MNSHTLKTEALAWLRFGKKLDVVCTEVRGADVLGVGETYSVEVEVKLSKADLLRDFTDKPAKHALYRAATTGKMSFGVPSYFYFYVPESLEKEAVAIVAEKMPNAGVAVYVETWVKERDGNRTRVAKKAKRLHDKKPTERIRRAALLRMGSELCGRHIAWRKLVENTGSLDFEAVAKTVAEAIAALPQTPDWEEETS